MLEFGDGPCEVYSWYPPEYRYRPDGRWPVKIGWTGSLGLRRRLQDFYENLPEMPHYLLRIGCTDEPEARNREKLLHTYFEVRKQRIESVPGSEWFLTNPDEIEEAINLLIFPNSSKSR